jgi:hypothetical protein
MNLLSWPLTSWYVVSDILEEHATSKMLIISYQTTWYKPQVHKASLDDQETLWFHTVTHNCLNTSCSITDFSSSNYIQYRKHLMSTLWFLTAGFPNKILYFPKSMLCTLTEATAPGQPIPKWVTNVSYYTRGKKIYIISYHIPYGIFVP